MGHSIVYIQRSPSLNLFSIMPSFILSGHITNDCFGPDSTRSFLERLRPPRVGYRKSDRLLFLNMLKNSSRSKTVVPWSSWSSEGPLKVPLSRPPWSFRIASVALFRVSCVVSTERKHPTLTRSLDDKDDHGYCILACFKTADDHFSEAIQDDNGPIKKNIHRGKSGPDRADWKVALLGEMPV